MTFKRNASDAFAYYWVIAMYTLSVYEFVSFVRYTDPEGPELGVFIPFFEDEKPV